MAPNTDNPVKADEQIEISEPDKKSIIEHVLVPPHRKINDDEKEELLTKFQIKAKNLPKISIKDPVIKTMEDVKAGDVIEIKRKSTTAGETIYYRVIIND